MLLVDYRSRMRKGAEKLALEDGGHFRVELCTNGFHALVRIRDRRFCAVFVHAEAPVLNALHVSRAALRQDGTVVISHSSED